MSIDSQRVELERLAERLGLPVADVLTEAKSAKAPGRPVFSRLLERIGRGEAEGILCWKLDRLARNPIDGGALIWALKKQGLEIITPTQSFRPQDDNTILLYIEFGMAQKYIDDLSRNVKRGNRAKLERGGLPGIPPQGYLNDRLRSHVVTDPIRFPLIRRCWELLLTGRYTVPQIWRTLHQQWGYRTRRGSFLANSALYTLFTNPFYCGLMDRLEGTFRGNHEPMITEAEFWRAQEILGRRGRPRPKRLQFAYSGLIHCGDCGCMITAEAKVQRHGHRYTYYHCTHRRPCAQRSIEAGALNLQVAQYLQRLSLSPRFLDWAFSYLDEANRNDHAATAAVRESLNVAIASAEKQVTALTQLRIRDLISESEFVSERSRLRAELADLQHEQNSSPTTSASGALATLATFILATRASDWFSAGGPDTSREIIDAVGSNLQLKDKILSIDARKPFQRLADQSDSLRTTAGPLEPSNGPGFISSSPGSVTKLSAWRAQADDVRTYLSVFPDFKKPRALSDKAIRELKEALRLEYAREFEEEEVEEIGLRLRKLLGLLVKPLPGTEELKAA